MKPITAARWHRHVRRISTTTTVRSWNLPSGFVHSKPFSSDTTKFPAASLEDNSPTTKSRGTRHPNLGRKKKSKGDFYNNRQQKTTAKNYDKPSETLESAEKRGSAALAAQFELHKNFVDEIQQSLDKNSSSSSPAENAVVNPGRPREALQFFISRKVGAYAAKQNMPDIPDQCTKIIVDYLEHQYFFNNEKIDPAWIQAAVRSKIKDPCGCGALVATMRHFMEPFKGTAYSMRNFGHRKRRRDEIHQSDLIHALQQATRLKHLIVRLVSDPACSDIVNVLPICNTFLELWNCRSWYLGKYSMINVDPDVCQSAFEEARHSGECVDAMLQYLEQMEQQQHGLPRPDSDSYTIYISSLAVSGMKGAAARAHQVLKDLEKRQLQTPCMYNSTLLAYCNEAKVDVSVVEGAKELFRDMLSNKSSANMEPVAVATLLNTYAIARMPGEAELLLLDLEQQSTTLGIKPPSRIEYNIVINSWAKSSNPDGVERAFGLFRRMLELAGSGANPEASPDKITYTVLIAAFARNPRTGKKGMEQAESLLSHAESGEDPGVAPDAKMYRAYMNALSVRMGKQKQDYARTQVAGRVESLLKRMREKSRGFPPSTTNLWHNTSMYNTAIAAWAKAKAPHAAERAVSLYKELSKEYKASGRDVALQPDLDTYHALLTCLGTRQNIGDKRGAGRPEAVALAQSVLSELQESGFPLTISTINLYLKVLSVSGIPHVIRQAEEALQSLEEDYAAGLSNLIPNEFSYLYVMDGYAKAHGGAEHAERLLNQMISISRQQEARKQSISPSNGCFNIVMDAWSRSWRLDSLRNVERIMQQLEAHGHHPDTYAYTTLIAAYSRDDFIIDAPEKAEAILYKMQTDFQSGKNLNCKPSNATFASVIKCWEKSKRMEAAERIEAIVRHMKELSTHKEYSHLCLNFSSLRLAILAWLNSTEQRPDAGDRAIGLLNLVDESIQSGMLEAHYAVHTYNTVLVTIARSRDGEKATKAYDILHRMKQQNLQPRPREFSAVLSACNETASIAEASELQKQEAFRIANITFMEYLQSNSKPVVEVYKEMLSIHTTLLGDDAKEQREKLVSAIFSNAPSTIQRSGMIQSALRAALPFDICKELINKAVGGHEDRQNS